MDAVFLPLKMELGAVLGAMTVRTTICVCVCLA